MPILIGKEAENFLGNLPVAKSYLVKSKEKIASISKILGYPLVLKIISKDAIHKTDINGVRIARNEEEANRFFEELIEISRKKGIKLDGILLQEYVKGIETIIGIKKDPTFGHVIMFGIGGTLVEVLKKVSFRVCPINERDAEEMIKELEDILLGIRGFNVDLSFLKNVLVEVSKLCERKNIEELDINPFVINGSEGKIVDARIVIK